MLRVQVQRLTPLRPPESPAPPTDVLASAAQALAGAAGIHSPYLPGGMIGIRISLVNGFNILRYKGQPTRQWALRADGTPQGGAAVVPLLRFPQ